MTKNGKTGDTTPALIMLLNEDGAQESTAGREALPLSPETVRKVADRVYRLLVQEARLDYERYRSPRIGRPFG